MLSRNFFYIIFCVIFFVFWFLFKLGGMPHVAQAIKSAFVDVAVTMATMLLVANVLLPALVYSRRYVLFFVLFFILVFISGSIIILTQLYLQGSSLFAYSENVTRKSVHYFYWFWADLVFGSYFLVFFISGTGASIRFAFDRLKTENKIVGLEREKKIAELQSLKNQINPHFLFNALNTIYYKIERSNLDARETLHSFSEMLRYQLYECNVDFISLEKELSFLGSYIELQKTRLDSNAEIIYTGFDIAPECTIAPFLLMPLVENCFKHLSNYTGKKNRVFIEATIEGNCFQFHTSNTKRPGPETSGQGIGLENVRKRLTFLYGNNFELRTDAAADLFELHLKLHVS